jgi:hypothetical protein
MSEQRFSEETTEKTEKEKGPECADASLCSSSKIRGGVVKPSERGCLKHSFQGRGSDKDSPSDTRPGGENSAGTLPKFRKRETSEEGRLGS